MADVRAWYIRCDASWYPAALLSHLFLHISFIHISYIRIITMDTGRQSMTDKASSAMKVRSPCTSMRPILTIRCPA